MDSGSSVHRKAKVRGCKDFNNSILHHPKCNYNWIYFLIIQRMTVKLLPSLFFPSLQLACCFIARQSKVAGIHCSQTFLSLELNLKTYVNCMHFELLVEDSCALLCSAPIQVSFAILRVTSALDQAYYFPR